MDNKTPDEVQREFDLQKTILCAGVSVEPSVLFIKDNTYRRLPMGKFVGLQDPEEQLAALAAYLVMHERYKPDAHIFTSDVSYKEIAGGTAKEAVDKYRKGDLNLSDGVMVNYVRKDESTAYLLPYVVYGDEYVFKDQISQGVRKVSDYKDEGDTGLGLGLLDIILFPTLAPTIPPSLVKSISSDVLELTRPVVYDNQ